MTKFFDEEIDDIYEIYFGKEEGDEDNEHQ